MARSTPPRPPTWIVALVGAGCLVAFVYAILAMGNPILGLLPILVAAAGYAAWRFLVAAEAAAAALQRIAAARERED